MFKQNVKLDAHSNSSVHNGKKFHTENKAKNAVSFLHDKKMFFHDASRQKRTASKISTF